MTIWNCAMSCVSSRVHKVMVHLSTPRSLFLGRAREESSEGLSESGSQEETEKTSQPSLQNTKILLGVGLSLVRVKGTTIVGQHAVGMQKPRERE